MQRNAARRRAGILPSLMSQHYERNDMPSTVFSDTSFPIITRARDMRPIAYTESAQEGLSVVIEHMLAEEIETPEHDEQIRSCQRYVLDLRYSLEAWESAESDEEFDPMLDTTREYLGETINEAEDLINLYAPAGWYFGSDENDPSYGGFYYFTDDESEF